MENNREKLSLSSSSTGRSSLLDAENSISEEPEDEVFGDSVEGVDAGSGNISGEEMEFFHGQADTSSQENLAVSSYGSALEISGIQPLAATQSFQDQSASGIYDSFSDNTTEEVLEEEDEDEAEKLAHVKRKILQDSIMSSASFTADEDSKRQRLSPTATPSIIVTSEVTEETPEICPSSPETSVYVTAPSSRRNTSVGGAASPLFDTTMEEMALYEMYGEDYDEVVAAMAKHEKLELRKKLESRGEKELEEIQQKFAEQAERQAELQVETAEKSYLCSESAAVLGPKDPIISTGSTVSPFSVNSSVNTATPSPGMSEVFPAPPLETSRVSSDGEEASSEGLTGPSLPQFSNNFMLPTAASLSKMNTRSPSPSPRKKMPWLPPSPSPSKASLKSPHGSARRHTPVSKLPQLIKKPVLAGLSEANPGPRTPMSAKRVAGVKSAYAAVASPGKSSCYQTTPVICIYTIQLPLT